MRRSLSLAALVILMMAFCSPALGLETEAHPEMSSKMVLVQTVLDILWKLCIPFIFGYLLKKGSNEKSVESAKAALGMGVSHSFENFVRPLKHDLSEHQNGKLKECERSDAKQWATNKAMEFATGGGKRVLIKWGPRRVDSLIEEIVAIRKDRKQKVFGQACNREGDHGTTPGNAASS